MTVAVVGAGGRTGTATVGKAVESGATVISISRKPARPSTAVTRRRDGALLERIADVQDLAALTRALEGADAVISAVGVGASRQQTRVYSEAASNLLRAMSVVGAKRLVVVSAYPAGPRGEQGTLDRRIVMPVLERIFGPTYEDMRRMEGILSRSDLAWTAVRPPRLLDRPATGRYRLSERPVAGGRAITIPDLASALLGCLHDGGTERRGLYVSN